MPAALMLQRARTRRAAAVRVACPAPDWGRGLAAHTTARAQPHVASRAPAAARQPPRRAWCGFAAGQRAEAMSGMSQSGIVLRALDQLDCIFGARPCLHELRACACLGPA